MTPGYTSTISSTASRFDGERNRIEVRSPQVSNGKTEAHMKVRMGGTLESWKVGQLRELGVGLKRSSAFHRPNRCGYDSIARRQGALGRVEPIPTESGLGLGI